MSWAIVFKPTGEQVFYMHNINFADLWENIPEQYQSESFELVAV